jgi:hypothetical protein
VSWMATVYYLREEYIIADKASREVLGKLCYDRKLHEEAETHLCRVIRQKDFPLKYQKSLYWDALSVLAHVDTVTDQLLKATGCCEELLLELKAKCGAKDPRTLRVMSLLCEVYRVELSIGSHSPSMLDLAKSNPRTHLL